MGAISAKRHECRTPHGSDRSGSPGISVVVPTCNRPALAADVLRALGNQTYEHFELIVVDQSDQPSPALEEAVGRFPRPARLIHDTAKGLARARNVGLATAKGDIVLYLEDDLRIDTADLVSAHASALRDPSVGGTTGRVVESVNKGARGKVGQMLPLVLVPGGRGDGGEPRFVETVKGGNMAFRRVLLQQIGGSDERFGQPSIYEDADVALKVRRLGYKIAFVPAAWVIHLSARNGGERDGYDPSRFRFIAYRDRVLLFRNNYPAWLFPAFLVANLTTGVLPLMTGNWSSAGLALRGLIEGIRRFALAKGA